MKQRNNFNPKQYRGKDRIYHIIGKHRGVSRIYIWDSTQQEYRAPHKGKIYLAKRYELDLTGNRKRVSSYFDDLQNALDWQTGKQLETSSQNIPSGITFAEVVSDWSQKKLVQKAASTQVAYEKMIKLYMGNLAQIPMREFTAKTVDSWMDGLKNPTSKAMKSKRRIAFDHELDLLSGILRFYREYHDSSYQHPILRRHREDAQTGREKVFMDKNISRNDFTKFVDELKKQKHGLMFSSLATVQYLQALRISEAAALHWDDVLWDLQNAGSSRLQIRRSVIWPRKRGIDSFIRYGFKNSKSNKGLKEHPLFPESYLALSGLHKGQTKGLIFELNGNHLEYRQIEYAYNEAFKSAGLPFRGTHILRHGGTRLVYNATKDMEVAKQLLGNRDLQTVAVYAQRDASALTQHAHEQWKNFENVVAIGRKP